MRTRWLAALAATTAFAGAVYFERQSHRAGDLFTAEYVNSQTCAACHARIWETYRRTGMARSFYRAATPNGIEDLKAGAFYHKASDSYFQMLDRGGKLVQRRFQRDTHGNETNVLEKEVHYVMGSGNHVRTYLSRTSRNTLIELPLAWYAENGGHWGMNPGYDVADNPGFRRRISYDCMFCHNAYPPVPPGHEQPGSEPVFNQLSEGIDCQRCHGPGSRHVEAASRAGAKPEDVRRAILNPARLAPEAQMEVCMQCHLETTSLRLPNAIVRYDRLPFSYRPGEPLGDFMLFFDHAPGKGRDDKFEIVNSAYRLRRSACFRQSAGRLLCTTCHNPHDIPRGEEAARHYTAVCRQCHAAAFDQLVTSGRHPSGDDCTGCHMPRRRTDDVVHAVMTDHYIQRRKPARDLLAEMPERHETGDQVYHGEVMLYYPDHPAATPETDLYRAAAQVSQESNLEAGIAQLTSAIEKHRPRRAEFYLELAEALRKHGDLPKAMPYYEEAIRRRPNFSFALRKYGAALRTAREYARATEVLKQAVAASQDDAEAWHELGLVYVDQGRTYDAASALAKAISYDPEMPEAHNNLGGILLESGDQQRAEAEFREALRNRPDYAEAHNNLANLLSAAGDLPQAREQFEAALRLNPDYSAARYNFGVLLVRADRLAEAEQQLRAVLTADPRMAEAHDLLGTLLETRGLVKEAIGHYEEALRIRPDFARAHLSLGAALANTGNLRDALAHLQTAAASTDPTIRQQAREALQQIERRK
jgi:predicted CXXCH cytochrome family protein